VPDSNSFRKLRFLLLASYLLEKVPVDVPDALPGWRGRRRELGQGREQCTLSCFVSEVGGRREDEVVAVRVLVGSV